MEPQKDKVFTDDMDRYVAWRRDHHVRVQFHFVTGYEPNRPKTMSPKKQETLSGNSPTRHGAQDWAERSAWMAAHPSEDSTETTS